MSLKNQKNLRSSKSWQEMMRRTYLVMESLAQEPSKVGESEFVVNVPEENLIVTNFA